MRKLLNLQSLVLRTKYGESVPPILDHCYKVIVVGWATIFLATQINHELKTLG